MESTVYIGDIHSDAWSLRESLVHAGTARRKRGLDLQIIRPDTVVLLGDLLDRGRQNTATLESIEQIMAQTKTHILLGNHDAALLQSMEHPEDRLAVAQWTISGGYSVLREVAKDHGLLRQDPTAEVPPVPFGSLSSLQWSIAAEKRHMELYDFPAAFEKFRELFRQRYHEIFYKMFLTHKRENALAVHAGIGRTWAEHIGEAEDLMLQMLVGRDFRKMLPEHPLSDILWRRRREQPGQQPFGKDTADILLKKGYDVLIHGHDYRRDGKHHLDHVHGIAVINADTGMSHAYKKVPNRWGYLRIDETGAITAASEASGGVRDFGSVADGQYSPPRKS